MSNSRVTRLLTCSLILLVDGAVALLPAQSAPATSRVIDVPPRSTVRGVFTMSATPVLDVGGIQDNPADEFDHVNGYLRAITLSDGGLAVIDRVKVRFFDVRGKQRAVVGSYGHGPNEFAEIFLHCRTRGDTVVVVDQNARFTVISPAGKIVRQVPQAVSGRLGRHGCFDNGSLLMVKAGSGPADDPTVVLNVVDLKGVTLKSLGEAPTESYRARIRTPVHTLVQGMFVIVADSRVNEIRQLGDARAVTLRLADKMEKAPANVQPSVASADGKPMQYAASPAWPLYDQVLPGANGSLWIQGYKRERSEPDVWVQIDAAGKLVGKLTIPAPAKPARPLQVQEFTRDGVLVDFTDDDGATHFRLFRLTLRP